MESFCWVGSLLTSPTQSQHLAFPYSQANLVRLWGVWESRHLCSSRLCYQLFCRFSVLLFRSHGDSNFPWNRHHAKCTLFGPNFSQETCYVLRLHSLNFPLHRPRDKHQRASVSHHSAYVPPPDLAFHRFYSPLSIWLFGCCRFVFPPRLNFVTIRGWGALWVGIWAEIFDHHYWGDSFLL